jgi:transglutaminase-like putative cysteine protease
MVEIRVGYELIYDCPQPTPMMLVLNIHYTRASDILVPDHVKTDPSVPIAAYRDSFGNWCSRIVAPKGRIRIANTAVVKDSGEPDVVATSAQQHSIQDLPEEALVFLLGSRYCDTEKFSQTAWSLFGQTPSGWGRVQAICDFVHNHISFGYEHARSTRTAWETFNERRGVCRDFAHLAIAFCRCMNIPARYCTGYLGGRTPALRSDGLRRLVRGVSRRTLVYLRSTEQRGADRASADGKGPRCDRRRHKHDLRAQYARQLQGLD